MDTLKDEARDVASKVADYVNHHSGSPQPFVDAMNCQHRTLQQGFTRLCIAWFNHLASMKEKGAGWYDMRNEASVKLAAELVKTEAWKDGQYLPII